MSNKSKAFRRVANSYLAMVSILFLSVSINAQSPDFFYGRLIDSNTGEAIPFATIMVKDIGKGVISNLQGDFSIPNHIQQQNDTLVISCIGYKSAFVDLKTFKEQELKIIPLTSAVTLLDEIVIKANKKVKKLSVNEIINASINKIPVNYPESHFSYVAYYRDYQTKADSYINLNEALVEVFDNGFHTDDRQESKIHLMNYREDSKFERDSNLTVNYDNSENKFIPDAYMHPEGGNEMTILMIHDAIRNYEYDTYSFIHVFKKNFVKNHKFKISDIIQIDDGSLYVIDFMSRKYLNDNDYQAYGQLYINTSTHAIHHLAYSVYKTRKKEKQLIFETRLEYAKYQDVMYLNYISFNNVFKTPDPDNFVVSKVLYNIKSKDVSVVYNNPYELESALNASNYKIKVDGKKVKIKSVSKDSLCNNKIRIELLNIDDFLEITEEDLCRLNIEVKNVTDIEGRGLNVRSYLSYNQYRELFVQQVNADIDNEQITFIDKLLPLKDNYLSMPSMSSGYWMNTPLQK